MDQQIVQAMKVMDTVVRKCHALQPDEHVVIVTDTGIDPIVSQLYSAAAHTVGAEPTIVTMVPIAEHGMDPPKTVIAAMKEADLIVAIQSKTILHSKALMDLYGTRFSPATVSTPKRVCAFESVQRNPGLDSFIYGEVEADLDEMKAFNERAGERLSRAKHVKITSDFGTNVELSIEGRPPNCPCGFIPQYGWRPNTGCFPDGECYMAPVEESTNGTIVFDTAMMGVGILTEPIRIRVEGGRAMEITGGADAQMLKEIIEIHGDENGNHIGEFSVGTNPKARINFSAAEAKKRRGCVHMALGNSVPNGGKIYSRIHLDGTILKPTVTLDGEVFIEKGVFKI